MKSGFTCIPSHEVCSGRPVPWHIIQPFAFNGVNRVTSEVAHFWLRPGNTACVSGANIFLGDTLARLPATVRVTLVRADSGFCTQGMITELESRGLHYVMTAALRSPVRALCRHDEAAWTPTEVRGIDVQDLTVEGARLVVLRQRVTDRPNAGGKKLLEVPGYKFQALRTNLPSALSALEVWRRYNGRADIENRIKELGTQFGLKGRPHRKTPPLRPFRSDEIHARSTSGIPTFTIGINVDVAGQVGVVGTVVDFCVTYSQILKMNL
jgi:hypothetical protein